MIDGSKIFITNAGTDITALVTITAVTGDGEMLMGIGSLATVGLQKPGNLSIVVLDNEAYGETGGQVSHTASIADLTGIAKACGIADSIDITTMAEVESLVPKLLDLKSGPRFANVKIDGAHIDRILPMQDGTFSVTRLRGALGLKPI